MVINDEIRKCVMFIAGRKNSQHSIRGTAFLVCHPIEGTSHFELYAVSTAHNVEKAATYSGDESVFLRLNKKSSTADYLKTTKADWEIHDDPRIDVAVMPLGWSDNDILCEYDHLTVGSEWCLTEARASELQVCAGSDIYSPGLFVRAPGEATSIPVVRTGTIAAIPSEPISTTRGMVRAYLAEFRSIGGHSGSPVFLNIGINEAHAYRQMQVPQEFKEFRDAIGKTPVLVGIVHGFKPIKKSQFQWQGELEGESLQDFASEDYNSGIAVVVPVDELLHVLNQPRLVALRRGEREKIIASRGTTIETDEPQH